MLPLSCTSLLNFNFTDPVLLITGSVFNTHPRTWPTVSVQKRLFNQGGSSVSSVAQWYLIPCDPMNCSTPGFPVHHQLPGLAQTHVHGVGDANEPSHPLSYPSQTTAHDYFPRDPAPAQTLRTGTAASSVPTAS